jgi:hypothetical protein
MSMMSGCDSPGTAQPDGGHPGGGGSNGGSGGAVGSGGVVGSGGTTGSGGALGTGGAAGGQDGGTGGVAGKDAGAGGQGGCTAAQQQEGEAFRAALVREYKAVLTYTGGSMPATDLTIRVADPGSKINCITRSANGGPIGYEIAIDMGFEFVTKDGAFNEKFSATVTKGFGSFYYDVKMPQGTFKPGAGYSPVVTLTGGFKDTTTTGGILKKADTSCPCNGMPNCVCPTSITRAAGWQ